MCTYCACFIKKISNHPTIYHWSKSLIIVFKTVSTVRHDILIRAHVANLFSNRSTLLHIIFGIGSGRAYYSWLLRCLSQANNTPCRLAARISSLKCITFLDLLPAPLFTRPPLFQAAAPCHFHVLKYVRSSPLPRFVYGLNRYTIIIAS